MIFLSVKVQLLGFIAGTYLLLFNAAGSIDDRIREIQQAFIG